MGKVVTLVVLAALLACIGSTTAQPFLPGQNLAPLGNLRSTDAGGPYNLSLVPTQVAEVRGAIVARANFTDADIIEFLTNVECLEGLFDTWGTFGRGFEDDVELGGPTPLGARKANLTERTLPFMEEVALNEQGHALLTRALGSVLPCPAIDFVGGFNDFMAAAFNLNGTVQEAYGTPFDPFLNDVNFVLSVLTLEELGATGNKGLSFLLINPVHANAVAGLATSATAQATVQRFLLWQLRNETVEPFGETGQQVFARISALRDSLDGAQFDDQGIVNTDPRFIAVPDHFVNLIPTDVHGLTFARTPQQNLNILFLGNPAGTGVFFPNGIGGAIAKPGDFNGSTSALQDWPANAALATQAPVSAVGTIPPPISAAGPTFVKGQQQLTAAVGGPLETAGAENRGLAPVPPSGPINANAPPVAVGTPSGITSPSGRKLF